MSRFQVGPFSIGPDPNAELQRQRYEQDRALAELGLQLQQKAMREQVALQAKTAADARADQNRLAIELQRQLADLDTELRTKAYERFQQEFPSRLNNFERAQLATQYKEAAENIRATYGTALSASLTAANEKQRNTAAQAKLTIMQELARQRIQKEQLYTNVLSTVLARAQAAPTRLLQDPDLRAAWGGTARSFGIDVAEPAQTGWAGGLTHGSEQRKRFEKGVDEAIESAAYGAGTVAGFVGNPYTKGVATAKAAAAAPPAPAAQPSARPVPSQPESVQTPGGLLPPGGLTSDVVAQAATQPTAPSTQQTAIQMNERRLLQYFIPAAFDAPAFRPATEALLSGDKDALAKVYDTMGEDARDVYARLMSDTASQLLVLAQYDPVTVRKLVAEVDAGIDPFDHKTKLDEDRQKDLRSQLLGALDPDYQKIRPVLGKLADRVAGYQAAMTYPTRTGAKQKLYGSMTAEAPRILFGLHSMLEMNATEDVPLAENTARLLSRSVLALADLGLTYDEVMQSSAVRQVLDANPYLKQRTGQFFGSELALSVLSISKNRPDKAAMLAGNGWDAKRIERETQMYADAMGLERDEASYVAAGLNSVGEALAKRQITPEQVLAQLMDQETGQFYFVTTNTLPDGGKEVARIMSVNEASFLDDRERSYGEALAKEVPSLLDEQLLAMNAPPASASPAATEGAVAATAAAIATKTAPPLPSTQPLPVEAEPAGPVDYYTQLMERTLQEAGLPPQAATNAAGSTAPTLADDPSALGGEYLGFNLDQYYQRLIDSANGKEAPPPQGASLRIGGGGRGLTAQGGQPSMLKTTPPNPSPIKPSPGPEAEQTTAAPSVPLPTLETPPAPQPARRPAPTLGSAMYH